MTQPRFRKYKYNLIVEGKLTNYFLQLLMLPIMLIVGALIIIYTTPYYISEINLIVLVVWAFWFVLSQYFKNRHFFYLTASTFESSNEVKIHSRFKNKKVAGILKDITVDEANFIVTVENKKGKMNELSVPVEQFDKPAFLELKKVLIEHRLENFAELSDVFNKLNMTTKKKCIDLRCENFYIRNSPSALTVRAITIIPASLFGWYVVFSNLFF